MLVQFLWSGLSPNYVVAYWIDSDLFSFYWCFADYNVSSTAYWTCTSLQGDGCCEWCIQADFVVRLCRQVSCSYFLSHRLHVCVSNGDNCIQWPLWGVPQYQLWVDCLLNGQPFQSLGLVFQLCFLLELKLNNNVFIVWKTCRMMLRQM